MICNWSGEAKRAEIFRIITSTVVLIVFGLCPNAVFSQAKTPQEENVAKATSRTISHDPSDPKELEVFLDSLFNDAMDKLRIPGLAFVLVKDGEVFFDKGYGYADLVNKKAVVPDKTLFRVGSVSKLFTATAIMQLCDQGLIRLDADVNEYLAHFQLDEDYPEPITTANLLTHSAGFRGGAIGSSIRNESEVMPLREYLEAKRIPRAMPPGQVINYSNYGYNLAGYLVEEVSGIPFADYIDKNILQPLDMEQSSFVLKPNQASESARSYVFENGNYEALLYKYGRSWPAPCGSLIGTATDMARFMIAHLQHGRYGDNQILDTETAREMHQQQFVNHPQLPGLCYGFYEYYGNNLRAIMHDGDISGFSSRMFLIPDHDLGFFVCHNGGPSGFRMQLTSALLDRYYPDKSRSATPQPSADFGKRADLFAGSYRSVRQDIESLDKLRSITALINIASSDNGIIWTSTQSRWVETGPLLFQYTEGKAPQMAFRESSDGTITHLFLDFKQMPIAYERVAWYDMPPFTWSSLGFMSFVFLSSFAIWPIMNRMHGKREEADKGRQPSRFPRLLATATVALNSVFITGFSLFMLLLADELEYGVPLLIKALLVIPIITTILAAALLFYALLVWRRKYWGLLERWYYTLIALTCVVLVIWSYQWNLLGFHY